ncbi:MAG: hypothetical protein J3K34DRAFT_516294 [Monoraphidium minutum]|nr:MAG: hypothetical protein J3K34DRAFT_516294 [Monoraphidium minutum]
MRTKEARLWRGALKKLGASGFVSAAAFEVLAWLEGKGYVESGYRLGVLVEGEGKSSMYTGYLYVKFTEASKLTPCIHIFWSNEKICRSAAAALQMAGVRFCFDAGVCPDSLLDGRGKPGMWAYQP